MSSAFDYLQDYVTTINWVHFATIPLFTGVIGWLINWTGLVMLFAPLRFHGITVPGLREIAGVLPRKVQEVPGLARGGLGWQGIIPARAAKMGSIAVDKAIAKLGTPGEFYTQLEPDRIAEHIVQTVRPQIPALVDEVMHRERPRLWQDLPPALRAAVVRRVQRQLPTVVRTVTTEVGNHIDQLLDPKIMVIDHFRDNPALVVRLFGDVGRKELNLMVAFGGVFGFLLGIPVAFLDHALASQWWVLPACGVVVGWITNLLGMWVIFEPVEARRIGPFTMHGLFLRRQEEAAEVYADIIAHDVITLERIGDFLINGPSGDRTRQLLITALRPVIEDAAGPARIAVRVAVGGAEFDRIRDSFSDAGVERTLTPLRDAEFSRAQSERIRALVATRTKELPSTDFVEMMRSAIREDEWMLYAHGAIMGAAGGFLHYAIFVLGGFGA